MMINEGRVLEIERRLETVSRQNEALREKVTEQGQMINKLASSLQPPQTAASTASYWCRTPGSVAAATGTWPSITPATFTADVYKDVSGTLTLVTSSATVRWFYKDAAVINKLVPLASNGDGTYDALADSCTAV